MQTARHVPAAPPARSPQRAALRSSLLDLGRHAGNRALASVLQRKVGWTDASQKGYAWNADERRHGKVRRIPLEGLGEGVSMSRKDDKARVWIVDDAKTGAGHFEWESTNLPALSTESAKGKAIVLVPAALDAKRGIEVVVFLHGYTEGTHRPFAGLRALDPVPGKPTPKLKDLRKGIDTKDVAPVRDVSLDEAEQQLQESGQTQLVIVIPQGGLHSQFSKEGTADFAAKAFVAEVVARLQTEKRWYDAKGAAVAVAPTVTRTTMSGHSGAGAALSAMASRGDVTGDLVLYDAINGSTQLGRFVKWVQQRLDADLAALSAEPDDAKKLQYLQRAQKLRGYCTRGYLGVYVKLDDAINAWFKRNKAKLGALAPCLRANYTLEFLDVHHEELMRGSAAGTARAAGTGTLLDAMKGLHPTLPASIGACPPMPAPLSVRAKR